MKLDSYNEIYLGSFLNVFICLTTVYKTDGSQSVSMRQSIWRSIEERNRDYCTLSIISHIVKYSSTKVIRIIDLCFNYFVTCLLLVNHTSKQDTIWFILKDMFHIVHKKKNKDWPDLSHFICTFTNSWYIYPLRILYSVCWMEPFSHTISNTM